MNVRTNLGFSDDQPLLEIPVPSQLPRRSFTTPLEHHLEPSPAISAPSLKRVNGRWSNRARGVQINGRRFKSMTDAAKKLRCSITRIYYLIGEHHRFKTSHAKWLATR